MEERPNVKEELELPEGVEIPKALMPYKAAIAKMVEGLPAWKARDRILALRASSYKRARTVYKTPTGEEIIELPGPKKLTRYMIMRNGSWRKVQIFG